ncbi:4'-phosphopantetheinyl transferase superfamily protein [Emticicia sp. BO119]|uniref:4'-phosphopantetheinyl transferase family protein n=1 Tax=Emticicia sp. BO119 TaxID=2757768 RepID=UPI0015F07197|nr:4'-phosphopantetheinyl transferase superfamily protein [Emticicia sp. BO119]MBA4852760.1 4'-phosphopantetheinyl transferase superfamily protein [Emticicia sp. BO119]
MPITIEKTYTNHSHLAVWHITESHDTLQAMLPSDILTDAELAGIHHPQKQIEFFCSRLTIKYLADKLGTKYLGIKKDQYGKPYLVGSSWQFSLTHTTEYIAVVMHESQSLGIDLEQPHDKLLRIAHKYLSETEINDADNDLDKLCIYWSAKEALYKLYGKRKVIFIDNLLISPFTKDQQTIIGRLKINEIDQSYTLIVEKIAQYYLVMVC